jgi:hypothetical protein
MPANDSVAGLLPRSYGSMVRAAGICCVLGSLGPFSPVYLTPAFADEKADRIETTSEPGGGIRATATLHLTQPPSAIQQVLTDYENWPNLFGTPTRLAGVERRPDRVVTDVYIQHPILPGERRLLCETRLLPEGGLVTTLIEGDFTRYVRTWRLSEAGAGTGTGDSQGGTIAQFELLVEIKTLAPDWLVGIELKRQLEKHFRILRETAARRAASP